MSTKHLQLSFLLVLLAKTIIASSDDGYVTNFSRTSSYVSKQATNREELDRSSKLERELDKLRREPCVGGRLQSANLQDGSGSIACTTNEYKVTSDKLRDLDSKFNLGLGSSSSSSSSGSSSSSKFYRSGLSSSSSSPSITTSKTYDHAPFDRLTDNSKTYHYSSSSNIKTDLPSYSRYTDSKTFTNTDSKTFTNTDTSKTFTGTDSKQFSNSDSKLFRTPNLNTEAIRQSNNLVLNSNNNLNYVNINTNSGQLASKLTNQIDQANSHLDASSKVLSQQHSVQSTIGKSIHGLHDDTHSLSNSQNQHYGTSFQSKTYGGKQSLDFSGTLYSKTKLQDHSHLHKDTVTKTIDTHEPAYTKTFDIKGGSTNIQHHNDKLRIDHTHSIKGGHGTSVLITDEEERRIENERRKNIVRLNSSDRLNSHISTNKTDTYLFCESGEMLIKINFTKKFFGIVYANTRDSSCRILGNGDRSYELHIPLNGCGTKKDERLFVNNITVRFHQTLELEEDEIKTVICRYPPPAAPIPVIPLIPIVKPTHPAPIIATENPAIEYLLIICVLVFIPLLLLGLSGGYFCLRKRNIQIGRKRHLISGAPSQITKISHSTFEPVRIPRVAVSDYTSESDAKTIISDSSSLRKDQYYNQKLQHIPELKVQLLDTTYLANQRFVEEETENIVNKKLTTNYFKKVPPLPPASIPDNDNWSHSEFTDIVDRKEYTVTKPIYTIKTEKESFIDLEKDMSVEEKMIKNKNIVALPTPKYQVKNINDTFVTNIKETATSCEKLCDYVINNQTKQNQRSMSDLRSYDHKYDAKYDSRYDSSKYDSKSDQKYLSTSSSFKYEDSFMYERKFNVLKHLFDQPLPKAVQPPKAGFVYLTEDEKAKWSSLLKTDQTFKNLIIECSSYDDYIRLSRDLRYDHYFNRRTWECIINTLSNREIISRWNANVYDDQKFNDNVELSFNSETQELLRQSDKQYGGNESSMSYSKQINKLVDGGREEHQFESSQYMYRSGLGGSGLVSIPRLSGINSGRNTAEHKSLLDQEEVKSVTETQVDDHYYKRTLRK